MVLRECGQVIMTAAMDPDERDLMWVKLLQPLAVPDRYQSVARAVEDIGMAVHFPDPFVGAQVKTQYPLHRQYGQEPLHYFYETVIRRIEDKVARVVVGREPRREAAAHASSIQQYVVFGVLDFQLVVDVLHIGQHIFLRPLARALAETTVVYQQYIIIIPEKILCIFCPSLDAARIAVEVQDESFRCFTHKMQRIDANARRRVEEEFGERTIIFELEISFQLLRLENKPLLQKIRSDRKRNDPDKNVKNNQWRAIIIINL